VQSPQSGAYRGCWCPKGGDHAAGQAVQVPSFQTANEGALMRARQTHPRDPVTDAGRRQAKVEQGGEAGAGLPHERDQ